MPEPRRKSQVEALDVYFSRSRAETAADCYRRSGWKARVLERTVRCERLQVSVWCVVVRGRAGQ